jgi:hypothetical protein
MLNFISGLALGALLIAVCAPVNAAAASLSCDSLRREPCEGEACLAKYKAIQDCENAASAEEQARRRRQQQRQRDYQNKLKKELDAQKDPAR